MRGNGHIDQHGFTRGIFAVQVAILIQHARQAAGGYSVERLLGQIVRRSHGERLGIPHVAFEHRYGEDCARRQLIFQRVDAGQRALEVIVAVFIGIGGGGVRYRRAVLIQQRYAHARQAAAQRQGGQAGIQQHAARYRGAAEHAAVDMRRRLTGSQGDRGSFAVFRRLQDHMVFHRRARFRGLHKHIGFLQQETHRVRRGQQAVKLITALIVRDGFGRNFAAHVDSLHCEAGLAVFAVVHHARYVLIQEQRAGNLRGQGDAGI